MKTRQVFSGDKMKYKDADIENWAKTWEIIPEDIQFGEELTILFKPFIKFLKDKKLSKTTINDHIDNLWLLGGFIIRKINEYPELRKKLPILLLPRFIDSWDGPNITDLQENDQKSFDRTCRKYYKYLSENELRKFVDSGIDCFD